VDVSSDLTFGNIEINACPRIKLLDDVQERDHILNRVNEVGAVTGVPLAS